MPARRSRIRALRPATRRQPLPAVIEEGYCWYNMGGMLSLENDVGPFLAMCLATQRYGVVAITFKGREGIVKVEDVVEMRRPEEIMLRTRHMAGSRPTEAPT